MRMNAKKVSMILLEKAAERGIIEEFRTKFRVKVEEILRSEINNLVDELTKSFGIKIKSEVEDWSRVERVLLNGYLEIALKNLWKKVNKCS